MKEITKNQATAIWQIFFVLWLTVGSIVCFNIHCITSEPPIYAPMFAITPLYLIEFYFDHPYTVQAILFQNFVLILMPALLWFLTYKSVYISSQNHGYMVDGETVNPEVAEVAFINVNDKTVEGLRYKNKSIFTVQFHPEACPGPQDSDRLFDEFIQMMEVKKNA